MKQLIGSLLLALFTQFAMAQEPDSDGDGIKDSKDECPFVKGSAQNKGCPDAGKPATAAAFITAENFTTILNVLCENRMGDYGAIKTSSNLVTTSLPRNGKSSNLPVSCKWLPGGAWHLEAPLSSNPADFTTVYALLNHLLRSSRACGFESKRLQLTATRKKDSAIGALGNFQMALHNRKLPGGTQQIVWTIIYKNKAATASQKPAQPATADGQLVLAPGHKLKYKYRYHNLEVEATVWLTIKKLGATVVFDWACTSIEKPDWNSNGTITISPAALAGAQRYMVNFSSSGSTTLTNTSLYWISTKTFDALKGGAGTATFAIDDDGQLGFTRKDRNKGAFVKYKGVDQLFYQLDVSATIGGKSFQMNIHDNKAFPLLLSFTHPEYTVMLEEVQ